MRPLPPPPPGAITHPTLPVRIIWPESALVAVGQNWRRLEDGRIEATFNSVEELATALRMTRIMREVEAERRRSQPAQGELIPSQKSYYQEG